MTDKPDDESPAKSNEERTASEELSEALDHFRSAAGKLFSRAPGEETRRASEAVDRAMKKIDPMLRAASKKTDDLFERVDPALDAASREAERVIGKLGATAEPLARQLSGELEKLGKRFGAVWDKAGGRSDKKRPPPED